MPLNPAPHPPTHLAWIPTTVFVGNVAVSATKTHRQLALTLLAFGSIVLSTYLFSKKLLMT